MSEYQYGAFQVVDDLSQLGQAGIRQLAELVSNEMLGRSLVVH